MGSGSFDSKAYAAYSSTTTGKTTDKIYTSRVIDPRLNPRNVKTRESRDSADNPNSTPLIVGIDVTGSMGMIADTLARKGLGTLFTGVLDRKPINNPHVMFMAIGDANCDQAPLQVSQFEADNRIVEQLTQIYLEGGGGGNRFESYNLPWYFAARHTAHDSLEKRGKRGYLFTVGDEEAPQDLTVEQIRHFIGDDLEKAPTTRELLIEAQRLYDVYHVIIAEGSHARSCGDDVRRTWRDMLGQKVIWLQDHTKLAETIVTAIEIAEGRDGLASSAAWGAGTATIVADATAGIPRGAPMKMIGAA